MSAISEVYEEMAEILAQMDPVKVMGLQASPARRRRLEDLLEKNRNGELSDQESAELDRMLLLNRMIGLAKIRAKRLLDEAPQNSPQT